MFHTNPNILHYKNDNPGKMEVGHVFTIEPMICEGTFQHVMWNDGWTATTKDGRRTAQFEHTLLITPDGVEPLTGRLPTSSPYWWDVENYSAPPPGTVTASAASRVVAAAASAPTPPTKGFASASAQKKAEKAKAAAAKKKKKKGGKK